MKHTLLLLFLILTFCACKQPPVEEKVSVFDSTLEAYFATIDKLPYYDTHDFDHQLLKAYYNKDTAAFKSFKYRAPQHDPMIKGADEDTSLHNWIRGTNLKELYKINADTVYRIIAPLGWMRVSVITASITNNTCTIHGIHLIDTNTTNNNYNSDLKIECETNKVLTEKGSRKILSQLDAINFWKDEGDQRPDGCFPGYVIIKGYTKNGNRAHAILVKDDNHPEHLAFLKSLFASVPELVKCTTESYMK